MKMPHAQSVKLQISNLVRMWIVASPCPWITNHSSKGRGRGNVNNLDFGGHQVTNHIYGTAAATVVRFRTQVCHIKSQHMDDKSPFKKV